MNRGQTIKYYFCEDVPSTNFRKFAITPKDYFDSTGFLIDTSSFAPQVPGFQRVADSTFEFVDESKDPVDVLLKHGAFAWRDMLQEIKYTYKRRRLLGIETNND